MVGAMYLNDVLVAGLVESELELTYLLIDSSEFTTNELRIRRHTEPRSAPV
jgi:hypothetical protein